MRLRVDADSGQTVLSIAGSGFSSDIIHIFQIKNDPPRLVIDCKSCPLPDLGEQSFSEKGGVEKLRMARRPKGALRIVLDLADSPKGWDKRVDADKITVRLTRKVEAKEIRGDQQGEALLASHQVPVPRLKPNARGGIRRVKSREAVHKDSSAKLLTASYIVPVPRLKPGLKTRVKSLTAKMPIIVIDPGHGGHDPGAIGKGGAQEKSITLKAALELKNQLVKTGRYKVILTRADDRYIKHDERLRIARADGADLFISLHADSAGPSARGASVYTLADRAIGRSKHIVNSQNWIMDVDLSKQTDPVGDILVDLAQRKTFSHSTRFADNLIGHLKPKTKLVGNTHRRAGYFVLLAPDVPAVLLELGFISNAEDEKLLQSARHRQRLMSGVTTAINSYFDRQKT